MRSPSMTCPTSSSETSRIWIVIVRFKSSPSFPNSSMSARTELFRRITRYSSQGQCRTMKTASRFQISAVAPQLSR